jgi:hypothetical protein
MTGFIAQDEGQESDILLSLPVSSFLDFGNERDYEL